LLSLACGYMRQLAFPQRQYEYLSVLIGIEPEDANHFFFRTISAALKHFAVSVVYGGFRRNRCFPALFLITERPLHRILPAADFKYQLHPADVTVRCKLAADGSFQPVRC